MKILCLSDLHRIVTDLWGSQEQEKWIASLLEEHCPDTVLITGDIFEHNLCVNPYEELDRIFGGVPVICTLGNHEFSYMEFTKVLKNYKSWYDPGKWNVHYLDVVGSYDVGNVHFFGNVLWYDGSTATVPGQNLMDFAGGRWLDRSIIDFDPVTECEKCVEQIIENKPGEEQIGILCTHTVPDQGMNGHYQEGQQNLFDAFSGVSWLLEKVKCTYAVSGHTHRRIIGKEISGACCINVGNDYYPPFLHYLLEV